jgi:predicted pyridoxine 5'-phosphate oxidase superfamily flavin-nucleotide-binding protein
MENYAELMFTKAVQAEQEADGTRALYAQKYPDRTKSEFSADEVAFLESRTSIYIASVSETGWPYLQHRGGPRGFIKVLDGQTLGFADYRGNRQYISKGNLQTDDRVSVFAMDYARKARLKLQGRATMQEAEDAPDLAQQLATEGQGRVERVLTIRIVAMDWNCPQFITPRFDTDEIAAMVGPEMSRLQARIAELEAEIAKGKNT